MMSCEVASWLPVALAGRLAHDRSTAALITWLGAIRDDVQEYDALVLVRPPTPHSEENNQTDTQPSSPDSAFDEILSQLGHEIYKLDEYQRNLAPVDNEDCLSQSILNIFEECLFDMTTNLSLTNNVAHEEFEKVDVECEQINGAIVHESAINNGDIVNNSVRDETSDTETLSEVSIVTSTPLAANKTSKMETKDIPKIAPVPAPRVRLKTPSTGSSNYDNIELSKVGKVNGKGDSDSESTCWSYKECSTDTEMDDRDQYAEVWSHASGYHRSDAILRRVLSQHHAIENRLSFYTAVEWPPQYRVYALNEVGDRCEETVVMTPQKTDDGYEPVRDAITTDENIYEEIEYSYNTDEGCSCGGSVEVESCSISASSEGMGRESPLYANLKDNDAYAVPADVIAWKNLLLHPFYNDDEEDEWITPEECAAYTREQRPPLIIPRITQYKAPRYDRRPVQGFAHSYPEENLQDVPSVKSSVRQYERFQDWSPISERSRVEIERGFGKPDSPLFGKINKRLGGSTENLLNSSRRPNQLHIPPSSSGDSLDIEIRDKDISARARKSRSMVTPKQRIKSPVPAPRMILPANGPAILFEGPVKRTKFSDGTKKCKKNWTDCYMILTPTALVCYKDQKAFNACRTPKPPGTPPSPNAPREELILPMQHAHAAPCINRHTKRYTRSIHIIVGYDVYLVQDETEEGAKQWLSSIQRVIYRLGPPPSNLDIYPQNQSSNTDLESLSRTPPVSRHHAKNKQKAGGSSNEDLSDTTEVSIQKSHVKSILRKFFPKRPAMEVLIKKGIYKDEPVFGRNLDEVCPSTSPRVPDFVVACIREIEKCEENMCADGLYRASGNLSQVQKIRLEIDQNNLSVMENYPDIHVLTGSLKLFFRELKEPLIPCKMFDRILSACSIKPKEAKIKEFRDIVQALPVCNRETLKYLLEHLLRVTTYSESNRMHTANLAIVFGPTLLWAPAEQAHNIAIDCIQQNNVVDVLLTDFQSIFQDDGKAKKKT